MKTPLTKISMSQSGYENLRKRTARTMQGDLTPTVTEEANEAITNKEIDSLARLVIFATPAVAEKFGKGSHGGYFHLYGPDGEKLLHMNVGDLDEKEVAEHCKLSMEKIDYLVKKPDLKLSRQTLCSQQEKNTGAIRLQNGYIISFSGFPWLVNEIFCVSLARKMRWLTDSDVAGYRFVSRSSKLFEELHSVVVESVSRPHKDI